MHSFKALGLLAVASSALAIPTPTVNENQLVARSWQGTWGSHWWKSSSSSSTDAPTSVETVTTTTSEGGSDAQPSATASSVASSSSASASTASSSDSGYMSVVEEWRQKLGLTDLSQDSTLEGNALKTAQESGGQLKHELNPGSFAQVLAPGNANDFESVFVGGWLCEVTTPSALAAACPSESQGWTHTETGHYDILTSGSYSKIGCALADGIWACDLA